MVNIKQLTIFLGIVAVAVITAIINPEFLSSDGIFYIFEHDIVIAIASMALLSVMIINCLDFSIGAVIIAVAYIVTRFIVFTDDSIPVFIIFLISIGLGSVFGIINGYIVSNLKSSSFVISMMIMLIIRGCINVLSSGDGISYISSKFSLIKSFRLFGIFSLQFIILVMVIFFMVFILHYTKIGRSIYVVGESKKIAIKRGCNVKKVKFFVFFISGLLAGVAAFVHIINYNQIYMGDYYLIELKLIIILIIGGVNIKGGYGTVSGTILSFLFLNLVKNVLLVLKLSVLWQEIILGILIVVIVAVEILLDKKRHEIQMRGVNYEEI